MWTYVAENDNFYPSLERRHCGGVPDRFLVFKSDYGPRGAEAVAIAEALNVHEQTGLTPTQLQARVAELEGALRDVRVRMRGVYGTKTVPSVLLGEWVSVINGVVAPNA